MLVCGHEILTPHDDSLSFELDWRSQVASVIAKNHKRVRLPVEVRGDSDIGDFVRFLRKGAKTRPDLKRRCERINSWHGVAASRYIIEALLLTEAPYEQIASDIDAESAEDVRLYQSLFFNVRGDSGQVKSALLRLRFSPAGNQEGDADQPAARLWKLAALTGGYPLLLQVWGIVRSADQDSPKKGTADITQALVGQELLRRLLQGRVENRDLIRMQQIRIERERLQHEIHGSQPNTNEGMELVRRILTIMRPQLAPLPPVGSEAALADKHRQAAERRIKMQTIKDRGPQGAAEEMSRRLRQKLSQNAKASMRPEP